MNQNELAREITSVEGGAVNLSIAQVKEVMKVIVCLCARKPAALACLLKAIAKETK